MSPLQTVLRSFAVLALGLCVCRFAAFPAEAQDRSPPRFGPLVASDTVKAGPFDLGRLWSIAQFPYEYIEDEYGVSADERGLRRIQRGIVRLPGCSGSIVSSEGLVLTAARCIPRPLSAEGDAGSPTSSYYAEERGQEQQLSNYAAERVVQVEEVTKRMSPSGEREASDTSGTDPHREAVHALEEEIQQESGADRVQVVREAENRYVAYHYERYDDVRLVFLPDRNVTVMGSPDAVLSYPQFSWDVAALRLYDDGQPLQTPDHLELHAEGTRPGDAVFAAGFPAHDHRAETHEQLAFRRDVELPAKRSALRTWTAHLDGDSAVTRSDEVGGEGQNGTIALEQVQARLESLQNEYFMERLRKRDQTLRSPPAADSTRPNREPLGLFNQLAGLQTENREHADQYRAFFYLLHPEYSSSSLRRAMVVERARQGADRDSLVAKLQTIPEQPPALDAALLDEHLRRIQDNLAPDSGRAQIEAGTGRAEQLVRSSVFSDPDSVLSIVRRGDIPQDDPLLPVVSRVSDQFAAFEDEWEARREREHRLTDSLRWVRMQQDERPVALPTSGALRISDGRVRGYSYNGTIAPPFTTFYGLYGHQQSARLGGGGFPDRWQEAETSLERSTPLTVVANTDMGGGEAGGPLLNTSLDVVGIRFDGNVQSAGGAYLFLPNRMRSVSTDVRGVLEGLTHVYGAESLVQELRGDVSSRN